MAEQVERGADIAPERSNDTADYIAQLTEELAQLARADRLDLLAYLLDIATLEASTVGAGRKRAGRRRD